MGPLLEQVLDHNKKTVKIIFKHFPLSNHEQAGLAAHAAVAAQSQGKFWEYHDEIFLDQKKLAEPGTFIKIARKLGLDIAQFFKELTSPGTKNRVKQDIRDGVKAGVIGTPSIFINGRVLTENTAAAAQKIINDELRKLDNHEQGDK